MILVLTLAYLIILIHSEETMSINSRLSLLWVLANILVLDDLRRGSMVLPHS